jgi:hypothetical protein
MITAARKKAKGMRGLTVTRTSEKRNARMVADRAML